MIGIKNIASYIPEGRESNFDKKEKFSVDDQFIKEKLGVLTVSRKAVTEETSDLCVEAFRALQMKEEISPDEIDCLVVCTQNPDADGLPHTAAVVHGKLGIHQACASFDISLGCSGYVYALSIVKSFMEANQFKKTLLFTADPYSKIIDPDDKNTSMLFGDAAAVTLLTDSDDIAFEPVKFIFETIGKSHHLLRTRDRKLEMNGRAIFNFAAVSVPVQISKLLELCDKKMDDIDLFIFHQASKYILDTLQKRMGFPPSKNPCNLAEQGNTVSSSIPLLLERYLEDGSIRTVVLSGFGVGLSCASCLIERKR